MTDLGIHPRSIRAELHVESPAIELATAHEQLVRDTTLACEQQKEAAKRLTFLRDHVLTSSCMARLWWLNNDPTRLEQLGRMSDDPFEKAVAALTGRAKDTEQRDQIAKIIETFLRELHPESRTLLVTQVANVFERYDRTDLARNLNGSHG